MIGDEMGAAAEGWEGEVVLGVGCGHRGWVDVGMEKRG